MSCNIVSNALAVVRYYMGTEPYKYNVLQNFQVSYDTIFGFQKVKVSFYANKEPLFLENVLPQLLEKLELQSLENMKPRFLTKPKP